MSRPVPAIEHDLDVANAAVDKGGPGTSERAAELSAELAEALDAPAVPPSDGLPGMKVTELRELADERGVDLTGVTRKTAIIRALRAAD